jgi:hypothetical protein
VVAHNEHVGLLESRARKSATAKVSVAPNDAASLVARAIAAGLRSVAWTVSPRLAKPMACVPIPHVQSSMVLADGPA